jgi:hypothetical protein
MMEEYQSIMKNDVWDVVPRPKGKFVVTSKCIYKIKHATIGSTNKSPAMHTNTIGQNTGTHETTRNNLKLHQIYNVSIMVLRMHWME